MKSGWFLDDENLLAQTFFINLWALWGSTGWSFCHPCRCMGYMSPGLATRRQLAGKEEMFRRRTHGTSPQIQRCSMLETNASWEVISTCTCWTVEGVSGHGSTRHEIHWLVNHCLSAYMLIIVRHRHWIVPLIYHCELWACLSYAATLKHICYIFLIP